MCTPRQRSSPWSSSRRAWTSCSRSNPRSGALAGTRGSTSGSWTGTGTPSRTRSSWDGACRTSERPLRWALPFPFFLFSFPLAGAPLREALEEAQARCEEVLASPQPDVIPEVEQSAAEEPPGLAPHAGPPLHGPRVLADQRVVARVQPREDPELGEVRVVDPGPLDELELPRDVALEGLEEEADLARDRGPGPIGDPPPHDPPLPFLRQPEGGVRPALVRL